jgi:probable phosphoglycerate mutase
VRYRRIVLAVIVSLVPLAAAGQQAGSDDVRRSATGTGTLRIYLARHGETASNAERRVVGQLDEPLNQRGRQQAAALRDLLGGVPLDAIYSSPLSRSLDTAALVAGERTVRVLDGLKERNQGSFQGLLADSAADFASRMRDPRDALGGGETTYQLAERVGTALGSIRRAHPAGAVLIVGHFLTNQMLMARLLNLPLERAMQINQGNDEVYLFELSGEHRRTLKLLRPSQLGDL